MASEQHQMGTMDISQHKAAWGAFMKMTTWGTAALVVLLILMAIFLV
ncbi:MAG: aa3-type cytochrome c oxidase subunit IV [Ferrovibrio sp.]